MSKTVYIHLGTGKTGTTALQGFFLKNRNTLIKRNILIPLTGMNPVEGSHHPLAFSLTGPKLTSELYKNPLKIDYYKDQLSKEVSLHKECDILLTSEIFPACREELMKFIQQLFPDYHIVLIIYLRRQDSLVEANYIQAVKQGEETRPIEQYLKETPQWNYLSFLDSCVEICKPRSFIVRAYEKKQFYKHNILADFLYYTWKMDLDEEFYIPDKYANPRLCRDALEFKLLINKLEVPFAVKQSIVHALLEYSQKVDDSTTKPFCSQELLNTKMKLEIVNRFEKEYEKIAIKYLDRNDARLFYDSLPEPLAQKQIYKGLQPDISLAILKTVLKHTQGISYSNQDNIINTAIANGLANFILSNSATNEF